jgi:hypothetical protein
MMGIKSAKTCPMLAISFRRFISAAPLMATTNHERRPAVLPISPKDSEMSDVAYARSILDDVFDIERTGRSVVIARAFDAVRSVERRIDRAVLAVRPRRWTERRVRSIVDLEAVRVDHYEIEDLLKVRIEEARRELARSRERAARMAAFLATRDEGFHGDEIQRLGAFARGVDLP